MQKHLSLFFDLLGPSIITEEKLIVIAIVTVFFVAITIVTVTMVMTTVIMIGLSK